MHFIFNVQLSNFAKAFRVVDTILYAHNCQGLISELKLGQNFTLGDQIHKIEIWNIDSKKYPEIVISEYFGILLPNSDRGTKLSHLSDSVYSRAEYHTHLM